MSSYEKFDKREKIVPRTVEIEENLYLLLEKLSKETYNASINKLVNASIETLIKTENLNNYERNKIRLTRTFLIRKSLIDGLDKLKDKYGTPVYQLINMAIRNDLEDEGLL